MLLNNDLFSELLPKNEELEEQINGFSFKARAYCTKTKHEARRAKSESVLDQILPSEIKDGETWHVMSSGDVDSLSFAKHIIKNNKMDYVAFSTWCMALTDVKQLEEWIVSGEIAWLDAYVGEIFPGTYAKETDELKRVVSMTPGRLCVFRNHSKVFLMRSGDKCWVIQSSANINTNPRTENTCITADTGLFYHHKKYFDSIKSFSKDFAAWNPQ